MMNDAIKDKGDEKEKEDGPKGEGTLNDEESGIR